MPFRFAWCCAQVSTSPSLRTTLGVLGLGILLLPSGATAQLELRPHENSRFWIQGEATTHDFTCVVDEVEGRAQVPVSTDSLRTNAEEAYPEVVVRVPIRAVDCGNSRMTRDLQETLEMQEHPEIRFELVHATMGAHADTSDQWQRVEALGPLTISGMKRLTRLHAAVRAYDDEHFRIRGCLPIRMTYFGIEPPTKAFGLIRVKNRVEVQFDLLANTTSAPDASPFDTISLTNPPPCDE